MIKRELPTFLIIGLLTVLIDFAIYRTTLAFLSIELAKGIGFISGTIFSYFANRTWTFGRIDHSPGGSGRFAFLYSATLLINVLVNTLILRAFFDTIYIVQIAFLFATSISAALNFFGMKYFVFRARLNIKDNV